MSIEACPNSNEDCKYYPDCYSDIDHIFYPKSWYKKPVESKFRNLDENKVRRCRREHDERHATEQPPEKPSLEFMHNAIRRAKDNGTRT